MAGKCQNMASIKIPRKLKKSGLFEEMFVTSGEFQQVIFPAIQKSYLSSESKNRFVYLKCQAVKNELLLEKFQEKCQEMQMGDLAESVAFLCVDNNQQVEKICQEGLKIGTGSSSYLGHPRLGVHLCRHADVLRPTPLADGVTYDLIVLKVLKGRVKYISESNVMDLQPTPGYDCHLSARSKYAGVPLQNLFQSTQLYLYEYGDDGILERPRHVCPIAVVQFQYRDSESLEKSRLHRPVSKVPEPAQMETLDYVLWSGRMTVKGLFACSVQIMSAQVMTKPVKLGAILNISTKVGMWEGKEKYLSNVTNLTAGKEFYNNGWYINVCEMKPVQPKSNYEKIKHYLASKQCMAVVKLEDDILLIMTDNDVTFQLGLSKHTSESSIHCIFLSKLSRKQKGHSMIQKPEETSKQSSTAPELAQIHQNFSQSSAGYLKHMHRVNDSYKQMSTNYSLFLSPKHPLARYPDANNNSPIDQPSELMECGSPNHKAQSSLQGQMDASARLIRPDESFPPPQTDLFEEIDLVESSKSPFPETYSDAMFDRVCQTENSQSGGIEITQQLQLSPGYSSRLAEALSLSSQETEHSLDDLPLLIPWLPVNISESAVTPLSSVADFQPSVTDEELPNQNNVNTHQNHLDNLFGNPDHLISQLNRSQESITPPPTLQIETHDNDSHNNSGSSFSHPPSLECSKISSDLTPGKTLSRSQSFEMIVPKKEVEYRFDDLDSNIKQIWPAASEQTTVGKMPYSSWPRHFMDALMEPATNNNDHFSTTGSSLLPNAGTVRNPELEIPSIRIKTEPQYSPFSCSEENLNLNEFVPGNRQFSGFSFIKTEPLEIEEFCWQDFPGFQDEPTIPLHRGSSLPDISGKVEPLHEYYIKHPQLHLLLDSGFWPKPPKTSLLKPEQVRNCFVEQAETNRQKTLPRASSLVDLQKLSKLYGDRKLEEIPLQSIVDLNRSVEKFLARKAKKSVTKSSKAIDDSSTCIAAKKYKESVGAASVKESVCIPAKRYKEPEAVIDGKKGSELVRKQGVDKANNFEEICKKAPKVILKKLKLHGKDSYKVEAHSHGDLLPTEAEEDGGAVDKNLTLKTKLTREGIAVSKTEEKKTNLSLQKSPHVDTNTGKNKPETEMPGLNSAIEKYMKEKTEKESKELRIESPEDSSLNEKKIGVETKTIFESENQFQQSRSPRDKKKENKHKRKTEEHSKTFKDATNVRQQSLQTVQSESKQKVDETTKTSENESRSPAHKKHKHEKHKEKKSKHSHKHKENVSEGELEKVAEKQPENKTQDPKKRENKDSANKRELEASKETEKEEIFSKALDEIVSAKVKEAIGGKKRKADEEHKTADVNKEKKIKSTDKVGTSNEKRKHSKTEPERTHSKERKNVKISLVSSSKQKAADKVLSALNMEARPVDVSSLGRIPKKQQAPSRKSKKDGKKTGETGTDGNELKEDSRQVAKQKKVQDSTISESKKAEHNGHVKKEHKSSEIVSDRGPISADDDILPPSTMEDFMQKQEHLFKTADSAKSSPGELSNSLFSNVLKTRPESGTIPGLGGVVDNTAAEDKVSDYSKRQIVKSASGLKCVLSGYDPVGRVDDPEKVDIVQCLKAALHGVRAKALRMDPVAKNIHDSLHASEYIAENKTITMSVDSKGTPSVVMKIDLSDRLPQNYDLATDNESTENNEQDKRSSTKDLQDRITCGSGKVAETENSTKNKQLCVESTNRKITSSGDKLSKADLLLQIPEKMKVNFDEDSDAEDNETEDGVTEVVKHEAEKADKAESLNLSFGTSLKQNLVDVHKIKTEKPDNYDTLCERYAGSSSKAGPEKPNLQGNQTPVVIEVTLKDKPKHIQTEKNTTINKKTGKVEPVNVTVEIGGELTKKQSAEKGKSDLTERSSLSSKTAESCESVKEPSKTTQANDAGKNSRRKSNETAVLSSGSLSKSNSELKEKLGDSPSRRRSRSKSKSKDEIDSNPSTTRSRANSESKSSRSSREKSQSKESTTTSGKSSRAGSETKDEKSAVSRSVNTSGVKSSGSQSKAESKKEEKKSIGTRLESLASKAIPASELAKADSRQSRQYHPYKKEEKKKKSRKPEWSFDMAYRDMNELLQNLTTNFFRDSNKAPAQPLRSVYSRSYNRRPRRFAGFVFKRSEIPKTPPRTRSPSPSADPESNKLTPEVIPDLKERQEKADLLEDIILETASRDGEEEEYSREQVIYGEEETEDNLEREGSVEREKTKNDTGDGKNDTSKSLKLSTLVIPGGPKTSLFSGTQLDDTNEESVELLNGTSARPFQTEISISVSPENEKTIKKSKISSHRGVGLEHRSSNPDPCSSEKSPKKDSQCAKELSSCVSELEKKKSLLSEKKCLKNINSNEKQVVLKEKLSVKENEAGVVSEPTVQLAQPTVKSNECKEVAKKNKHRLTLLSTDSDSCLDWTDEESALDKVDETGTFMSNDEFSDVGDGKRYLVVDSVGASDSDSYEDSKQEKNTENSEEIVEKAATIGTNNSNSHSLLNEPSAHMNKTSSEATCCGKTKTISKEDLPISDCEEIEKTNSLKTPFVTSLNETMNESQTILTEAGQKPCSDTVICNAESSVKSHTSICEEKDIHKNLNSEKLIDEYESIGTGRSFTQLSEENAVVTCESSSILSCADEYVNNETSSVTASNESETLHNVMLYTKVSEEIESVTHEMQQKTAEENERTTNERLPTPVNLEIQNVENEKFYTPVSKENGSVSTVLLDSSVSIENESVNNTRVYASETKEHSVAEEQAQEVYIAGIRYLDDTITKKENSLNTKLAKVNNMHNRKNDIYRAESVEEKDHLDINTAVHIPQPVIEVEVEDSVEISDSYSNDCCHSSFVPELENANSNNSGQSIGTSNGKTEGIEENLSEDQICMVVDEAVNTDQIVLAVFEEDECGYLKEIVGVVNSGLDSPVPDESRGKEGSIAENLDQIGKNTDSEITVSREKNDSSPSDDEKFENDLVLEEAGCVNNRIDNDRSGPRNTEPSNSCSEICSFSTSEKRPVKASTDNCPHAVNASSQFMTNSSKKHTEKTEGRNLKLPQELHSVSTVSSEIGSDPSLAESQQVDSAVLNVIHPAVPALPLTTPHVNSRLLDSSDSSLDIVLGSSDFESDLTDDTDILKQASRDIKQSLIDVKKKCNATLSEAKENFEIMGNIVEKRVVSDSYLSEAKNCVEKENAVAIPNPNTCSLISVSEVSFARTVATIAPLRSVTCTANLNPSMNSHCRVTSPNSNNIPDFMPASASSEQGILPNPFINSPLMNPTSRFMSGLEQHRFTAGGVNAMTYFRPPFQSYMYNMNRSLSATSPNFGAFIPQTTSAFDLSGWQNYQFHYPSSNIQEMQQYNFSPSQMQPWMFSFRFSPNYSPPNPNTYFSSVYARTPPFTYSYNYTSSSRFSSNHTHNGRFDRNRCFSNLIELTNKNNENVVVTERTEHKKDKMECFSKRPEALEECYQHKSATGSSGNSTVTVKSNIRLSQTDIEAEDHVCNKKEAEPKMAVEFRDSCSVPPDKAGLNEDCGCGKAVKCSDKQEEAIHISGECITSTAIHDSELDKVNLSVNVNAGLLVKGEKIPYADSQHSVVVQDKKKEGVDKSTYYKNKISGNKRNLALKTGERKNLKHGETLNQCIDSDRTELSVSKDEDENTDDNENMPHPVGIRDTETIENYEMVKNSKHLSEVNNKNNLYANTEINKHIQSRSDVFWDIGQADSATGYKECSTINQITEVSDLKLEIPTSDHNEEEPSAMLFPDCDSNQVVETHNFKQHVQPSLGDTYMKEHLKAHEHREIQNNVQTNFIHPELSVQNKCTSLASASNKCTASKTSEVSVSEQNFGKYETFDASHSDFSEGSGKGSCFSETCQEKSVLKKKDLSQKMQTLALDTDLKECLRALEIKREELQKKVMKFDISQPALNVQSPGNYHASVSDDCSIINEEIKVGSSEHQFLSRDLPSLDGREKMKNTAASGEIVKPASSKEPSKMMTHGSSMLRPHFLDADIKDCLKALEAKRKELEAKRKELWYKCVKSDSSPNSVRPSENIVDAEWHDKSSNNYNIDDTRHDIKGKHSGEGSDCEKVFSDKDGKCCIICDNEKSQFSAENAESSCLNPEERSTSEKHIPQANSGEPVNLLTTDRHAGSLSKVREYSRKQNTAGTSGVKRISRNDAEVKPDLTLKTTKVTESSLVPHVIQSSKSEVMDQEIKEFYNSLGSIFLTDYTKECQKDLDVKTKISKEVVTETFSNACDIKENSKDRKKSDLETYSKVNKDCSERDESQNSKDDGSIVYRELRTEEKSTVCYSRTLEGEVVKLSLPCAGNDTACSNALTSTQVKEKTETVDTYISKENKENSSKLKACADQSEKSDELTVVSSSLKCPGSSTGVKDFLNKSLQKHTSASHNLVDSKDNPDENTRNSKPDSVIATQNDTIDSIPVGASLPETCQNECNPSECCLWNGEIIPLNKTDICDKVEASASLKLVDSKENQDEITRNSEHDSVIATQNDTIDSIPVGASLPETCQNECNLSECCVWNGEIIPLNKTEICDKVEASASLNSVNSKENQDENTRNSEHDPVIATQNDTIESIPVGASLPETCQNECSLSECYVWNGEIIPLNKTDICDKVEAGDKNTSVKSYLDKISSTDNDRVQADQISVFDNRQSDGLVTNKSEYLETSVSKSSDSFDNTSQNAKSGVVSQGVISKHKSAVTDRSVENIFDSQSKVVQIKRCQKVMKKKKKTVMKKEVVDISHKKKKKNKIDLDKAVVSFYKELGIKQTDTNMAKDLKNGSVSAAKQGLVNYNEDDKSGKNTLLDKSAMPTIVKRLVAYDDDQNSDDSEIMEVSSDKNSQSSSKADESAKHKHNQYLIKETEAEKIEQLTLKSGKSTYEDGNWPALAAPFIKQTGNAYKESCTGINGEETEIVLTSDTDECKSRNIQKAQSEGKQMSNTVSSFKTLPSIDNLTNNSRSDSPRLLQVDPAKQFSYLKYKQTGIGIKTEMETGTNRIEESDFIKENDKGTEVVSSSSLAYSEQIIPSAEDTTQSCEREKYQNLFPNSDCITGITVSDQKCADADIGNPEASATGFGKSLLDSDGSNRLVTDEEIESWDTSAALTREQETVCSKTGKSSISLLCSAYDESSNESVVSIQNSSTVPKDFQDSLAVLKSYINDDSDSSDSHSVVSMIPNYNDDDLESRHADSISSSSEITESDIGGQADISTEKISSPTSMQNKMISDHMPQKARKGKELCNDEMKSYLRCKWIQDDILSPDSSDTESVCDSPCSDPDTVKAVSDSDELYQSDSAEHLQPLGQSLGDISTDDYNTEDIKPSMMSTKTARCNVMERPESQIGILNQSFQSQSDASDITNVLESSYLDSPMSNMSSLSLSKLEERRKRLTKILLSNTTNSSLKTESGECSDSDNSKASAVSNKRAHIQSWIQRGAEEKLISRLMLSEKLQEGWDSSSSDDESSEVHKKTRSKQFVILDSLSCADKALKSTTDLSDAASVTSSSDSQFYGKQSSQFQKAVQNSSSTKPFYARKRTHSSGSHEKSGKSWDKIDSENYDRWSVRQRSRSGSIASNVSHQDKRDALGLDRLWSRNRQRSSSKDTFSSHRSRESSSSDFSSFSRSRSREVFSSSSCDREQSDRRYSPNRESRRTRHRKTRSGTRKKSYSGKEQQSKGHRRSGNRSDSSESCPGWKNRPRNKSDSSESASRWKRNGRSGLQSDTSTGRLRHSSRSSNGTYTSSNEMWRIKPETEAENSFSELPAAYQVDARRHEISQSSAGRGAAKLPVERRIGIRHRTSSPIYGDENRQGDVEVLNQKEKVVILHSSTLASENLGDIQELIKSLAQYSTSRCHWKALVHSRMICDLDEWRSVNPECSKLLELMSAYRDMDHVELLPFHGCDEVRLRPDRCAEQIAAENSNVLMTFLIAGSRVGTQRKNQPGRPRVSTENPIVQLHALKKGKGIVYEEAGCTSSNQFSTSVTVSGKSFQGSGKTKKEAKQAAAKAALIERFNVLTVPRSGILSSTDPRVVICSIQEFLELHLTSKNT